MHKGDVFSFSAGQGDNSRLLFGAPGDDPFSDEECEARYGVTMDLRRPVRVGITDYGRVRASQNKIADIRNMPLYVSNNGCYYCFSLHHLRTILVSGKGLQDGWEHVPEVRILIFLVVVIQ